MVVKAKAAWKSSNYDNVFTRTSLHSPPRQSAPCCPVAASRSLSLPWARLGHRRYFRRPLGNSSRAGSRNDAYDPSKQVGCQSDAATNGRHHHRQRCRSSKRKSRCCPLHRMAVRPKFAREKGPQIRLFARSRRTIHFPAWSGARDFTTARLSRALMHGQQARASLEGRGQQAR